MSKFFTVTLGQDESEAAAEDITTSASDSNFPRYVSAFISDETKISVEKSVNYCDQSGDPNNDKLMEIGIRGKVSVIRNETENWNNFPRQ